MSKHMPRHVPRHVPEHMCKHSEVAAIIKQPDGADACARILDRQDGTYSLSCDLTQAGKHWVQVPAPPLA